MAIDKEKLLFLFDIQSTDDLLRWDIICNMVGILRMNRKGILF